MAARGIKAPLRFVAAVRRTKETGMYMGTGTWEMAHITERQQYQRDEAAGRLAAGISRGLRRFTPTRRERHR
jgi:hypothetical protein